MSSHLHLITNDKGAAIIVYNGEVVYTGANLFTVKELLGWMNFADAEYKSLHELTDKQFDNWENIIYD